MITVGSESIATGECILVKYDDGTSTDTSLDITEQWKAKVLEVRALDEEHVYLRISWLNRPEDLVGGRQPHHGRLELIPSNEMDVIDAMTVNGRLDVVRWDESQEDALLPAADQFFWRQTLDYTTGKLSVRFSPVLASAKAKLLMVECRKTRRSAATNSRRTPMNSSCSAPMPNVGSGCTSNASPRKPRFVQAPKRRPHHPKTPQNPLVSRSNPLRLRRQKLRRITSQLRCL